MFTNQPYQGSLEGVNIKDGLNELGEGDRKN